MNPDGLFVRFGKEEAADARGGELPSEAQHVVEVDLSYLDALSATPAIVGASAVPAGSTVGTFGVVIPKGAKITQTEILVTKAFTSSGTIGTSTLVLGFKKASDRSTELDHDGLTTTSFVGSAIDALGETTIVRPGTTGAGDDYMVAQTENGVLVASNSQHGSHPFTDGTARIRITYIL
ncbi:MAG: hypothetical protein AB7W16_15540 [Candidatus Obscuribacterales bacterium]